MSQDIDQTIRDFQAKTPTPEQLLNWALAAQKAKLRKRSWLQIASSVAAGIVLGILLAQKVFKSPDNQVVESFAATYVEVTVKDL